MIFENNDPKVAVPHKDLTSVVLQRANELGEKPALIDGVSGRTLSYTELKKQINHLASGLHQRGFKKGDVCAVFCPNMPEYATIFLGVASIGGINTTVNSLYSINDLVHQFNDSNAKFLITIPDFMDRALPAAKKCGIEEIFVLGEAEGATPFSELLSNDGNPPEVVIDPKNDLVKQQTFQWAAEQLVTMGRDELAKKNFVRSAQLFQTLLKEFPQHPVIDDTFYFQLGISSYESKVYNDWGRRAFNKIVEVYPSSEYYRGAKLWLGLSWSPFCPFLTVPPARRQGSG